MFTILDTINHFLSYLNFNLKLKNSIYTVVGTIANFYTAYLAFKFFQYQAYSRGILYLLIFLVLLYFSILNIIYYFTKKTVSWDISPHVEKLLGGEKRLEEKENKAAMMEERSQQVASGKVDDHLVLYDQKADLSPVEEGQTLTVEAQLTTEGPKILQEILNLLMKGKFLPNDFGQLKDKDITQKVYEYGESALIPSAALEEKDGVLFLLVGLNAFERKPAAFIKEVAGISVQDMLKKYTLEPASVTVTGGPVKLPGRSGVLESKEPYQLNVTLLCQPK